MQQDKPAQEIISKYSLDYLKHKFNGIVELRPLKKLSLYFQASYNAREGKYTEWTGTSFGEEVPYKSFWLVNSRISWNEKYFSVYAEASNIFDTQYNDLENLAQPGRWLSAGVKMHIGL
jgi:iron complex outermembrane receptor protein